MNTDPAFAFLGRRALRALATSLLCSLFAAGPAMAAGALDRAKDTGRLAIGYLADGRPFSYADASGKPAGYGIDLCNRVADAVKAELKLTALAAEFVALPRDDALRALEQGRVDILCGVKPTLERRKTLDFSIPVLLSGTGAVVRADAPVRLVAVLSGREPPQQPTWRASPGQAPERRVLAVVGGTTIEKAVVDGLKARRVAVDVVEAKDTAQGLQLVLDRKADAFLHDQPLLLDAARRSASAADLIVLDRIFQREQVALAVRRDDDDFRLLVDRTLSRFFRSAELSRVYAEHFGAPTEAVLGFFQLVALPD